MPIIPAFTRLKQKNFKGGLDYSKKLKGGEGKGSRLGV